jgi:hypothetical protein
MHVFSSLKNVVALTVLLALPVHAGSFTYGGTTAGGPTWNRPIETPFGTLPDGSPAGDPALGGVLGTCTGNVIEIPCGGNGLSTNGTTVAYSVFNFAVDQTGAYTFNSQQVTTFNGFIFIYQGTFNPSLPLNNFYSANNNVIPSNKTQSVITNLNLTAGTSYFFVTTGNVNTDSGVFANLIQGPGNITAIPEPFSVLGMLFFGAGAVGQLRKQKAQ